MAPSLRDFKNAIETWTKFGVSELQGSLDEAFKRQWLGSQCVLLAYARERGCDFQDEESAAFEALLRFGDHGAPTKIFLGRTADLVRATHQMDCLIQAVNAGRFWNRFLNEGRPELEGQFGQAVLRCIASYEKAFPLTDERLEGDETFHAFSDTNAHLPVRQAILKIALSAVRQGTVVTTSGFLAAQYLLTDLLEQPDRAEETCVESRFETAATVLLYKELHRPGFSAGVGRRVTFAVSPEPVMGIFLDPVALGMTHVDDDLLRSLVASWQSQDFRRGLIEQIRLRQSSPLGLRVSPDTTDIRTLSGESAGVIFTCGMRAAAYREQLDPATTASACLDRDNPAALLPVDAASLSAKLDAAKRSGIQRLLLQTEQATDPERIREAAALGIELLPATNLAQAWQLLIAPTAAQRRMEQVLADYGRDVAARWEDLLRGKPDDNLGLTHYVPPHYALGIQQHEGAGREGSICSRSAGKRNDRAPVFEPQSLEALLQSSGRLCIIQNAGTGKSVFTRMVEGRLSCPDGWRILTDGQPCLAVRWEHSWPDDMPGALVKRIRPYCDQQVTAEQVVQYAIDNRRVVLILDSLDRLPDVRKTLASLMEFLESAEGRNCRVIVTSRCLDEQIRQVPLFNDPAWRFARIEGFDEQQQCEYLKGLCTDRLDDLLPNRKELADILPIPYVLHRIRTMVIPGRPLLIKDRSELLPPPMAKQPEQGSSSGRSNVGWVVSLSLSMILVACIALAGAFAWMQRQSQTPMPSGVYLEKHPPDPSRYMSDEEKWTRGNVDPKDVKFTIYNSTRYEIELLMINCEIYREAQKADFDFQAEKKIGASSTLRLRPGESMLRERLSGHGWYVFFARRIDGDWVPYREGSLDKGERNVCNSKYLRLTISESGDPRAPFVWDFQESSDPFPLDEA